MPLPQLYLCVNFAQIEAEYFIFDLVWHLRWIKLDETCTGMSKTQGLWLAPSHCAPALPPHNCPSLSKDDYRSLSLKCFRSLRAVEESPRGRLCDRQMIIDHLSIRGGESEGEIGRK